jgi:hypothetical protein
MPDLLLTLPASAEHVSRARAAVGGYAARFAGQDRLAAIVLATGEAGAELVDGAEPGAALVVEVRRVAGDLRVTLRRTGAVLRPRRGLGARLLHTVAEVQRSAGPDGARIALTFRDAGGERTLHGHDAPGLLDPR